MEIPERKKVGRPRRSERNVINVKKVTRHKVRDKREANRAIAECIMGKGVIDDRAFSILCLFAVEWKKYQETGQIAIEETSKQCQ